MALQMFTWNTLTNSDLQHKTTIIPHRLLSKMVYHRLKSNLMSKMIDRKFIGSVLQKVSNYGAQNSTNISRNIYLQQIVNEAVLYNVRKKYTNKIKCLRVRICPFRLVFCLVYCLQIICLPGYPMARHFS